MTPRTLVPVLAGLLIGCPSPTKKSLKRAAEALEDCDVRTANAEFEDAYSRSPDDLDAALGFALTEVVMLAEDPNVDAALASLGFTDPIDAETLFYGEDALVDRLTSGDCALDGLEQELHYPPGWDDGEVVESLQGDVTVGDLLQHASKMSPRLKRIAEAFETAADELEEPYVIELSGTCGGGFGPMAIQKPELYAAASVVTAVRASLATAEGYDWELPLAELYDGETGALVDLYNAHLLHVVDHAAIDDSASLWLDTLDLADAALAAAAAIDEPVEDQMFDWSELDRSFVDDLREIGDAGRRSIAKDAPVQVPFWSPELYADVGSLFTDPIDAARLEQPLFVRDRRWVEVRQRSLEALFDGRFDRDVFHSERDESWDLEHWEDVDLETPLNPGNRYGKAFECEWEDDEEFTTGGVP